MGLVASRKKAAFLLHYLRAHDVPDEQLARVKAPAGLDLGGMTSGEIALSVAAEIVQRRHASSRDRGNVPQSAVRSPLTVVSLPIDPVCGMPVEPATATHTLIEGERTIYFCGPHCLAKYVTAHAASSGA